MRRLPSRKCISSTGSPRPDACLDAFIRRPLSFSHPFLPSLSLSIFHHGSNSPTDSFRFLDPGGFSIDGGPAKVAEAASLPGGSEDFNGSSHLSVPVLRRREETEQQTQAAGADRTGRKYACLILEQKIAIWTKTIELPD